MISWKEIKYYLGLSKLSPELISLWKSREETIKAKRYFEATVIPSLIEEGYCVIPHLYHPGEVLDKLVRISKEVGLNTQFDSKNGCLLISIEEVPEDAIQEG